MRKKVFITTADIDLATTLIRLLYRHGIDAFLVTEEEGDKLARVWEHGYGILSDGVTIAYAVVPQGA